MAERISTSLSWTFVSRIAAQFTQIVFSFFLARLLTPSEYGQVGMLLVFISFAQVLAEAGLGSAIIFFDKESQRLLDTAFWITAIIGFVLTALIWLAAPFISRFYESPVLADLARLMSLGVLLQAIVQVQTALLARRTQFKAIAISTYVAAAASSVVALALAYLGYGVWALAWQFLSNCIILVVFMCVYTRWLPIPVVSFPDARRLFGYSSYLLAHNALNYWLRNGDNMLIGRVLGAAQLGLYSRAYSLMLLPLQNTGAIVGQVMFPTLSKAKGDAEQFRALYHNSIRKIALITFPLMAGLSVLAEEVLGVLYGDQWVSAGPVLAVLSVVGLFQSIVFPVGWVFTSLGRTRKQFVITAVLTPVFFALIWFGLNWGILGVTWAYAIWAVISGLWNISAASRIIGTSVVAYGRLILPKAVYAAVMVLVIELADRTIFSGQGNIVVLLSSTALGVLTYAACLLVARDDDFLSLVRGVSSRLRACRVGPPADSRPAS